jgi:Asp-tRNA(Asn)/Glu-tRNA(Gln) amidotransferase A subunit family amidase
VAVGLFAVATGSQTGGSVIRPASYCGVAGFKPSYRLLPTVGMKCVSWHLDTAGLFAAGVADVAFATAAITGRDLRVDREAPAAPRIAILRRQPWPDASPEMQAAVETAVRAAEQAGAELSDIVLPPIVGEAFEIHRLIQAYEAYQALAYEADHHRERLGANLRKLMADAGSITAEAYDAARRTSSRARTAFNDVVAGIDVILSPSAPGAAPAGLASTGIATFNRLWTLLGTPCVSVPGLKDATGLPLGIQVIGRFGADRGTLAAARFVELALERRN